MSTLNDEGAVVRWRADPVAFVEEVLRDPETGQPFKLYAAEKKFLRRGLKLTRGGRLPFPELLFSAPKKSGKTALAAMSTIFVIVVLGGRFAEAYCVANDLEQAQDRVFTAIVRIIEASPFFDDDVKVTAQKITFGPTGATITALASDYAGAAGANPTITVFDELWAYTTERAHRLWDEMVPAPTRKVSIRLTVTYAGFEGESTLLESLYKRALAGKEVAKDLYEGNGMLAYWTHSHPAPWQTAAWREQMREQLRPNAYLRLIENKWVTNESNFIDPTWWAACVDSELRPMVSAPNLDVWGGLDASVKRDSTAIVLCAWNEKAQKVRLLWHRIFQPSPDKPLDFEATIEETILDLTKRFNVRELRYDPYQMASTAQRLQRSGVRMLEFPQSVPNLTIASQNLYELIKGGNLTVYPDDEMTLSVRRAVAIETTRGWRIAKEKASHKIDVVVALGMAAIGAVQGGQRPKAGPRIAIYDAFLGRYVSSDEPRPRGAGHHVASPSRGILGRDGYDVTDDWLRNG